MRNNVSIAPPAVSSQLFYGVHLSKSAELDTCLVLFLSFPLGMSKDPLCGKMAVLKLQCLSGFSEKMLSECNCSLFLCQVEKEKSLQF